MAGGFVAYYSVNALFATHLQKDLHLAPGLVATPIFFANLGTFLAACGWGWWADRFGRRWAIIIPALIAIPLAPLYLLPANFVWIALGFVAQGLCAGGGMQGQMAPYLNERFPKRLLLPPSAGPGRLRAAGINFLQRTLRYEISCADDHWHLVGLCGLGRGCILRSRDKRQGPGA